jgi:OmcA/MtrC family decaheme c-type cytochrome
LQEDASRAEAVGNGVYRYTFTAPIPADARGTFAVGLEGRRVETVLAGTTQQRNIQYGATNPVLYFSVDGSPVQERRQPADNANCLACHTRLAFHGENRVNNIAYCQFCHNPNLTDQGQRPAAAGAAQTVDFRFMIHRIHGGERTHEEFGTEYTVYGFGQNPISFDHVRYPGELNQCFMCHRPGTENPSRAQLTESPVVTPRSPMNPMPPTTAACYSCHQDNVTLSHAAANTTQFGEACAACHSATAEFSATRVHANEAVVSRDQASR